MFLNQMGVAVFTLKADLAFAGNSLLGLLSHGDLNHPGWFSPSEIVHVHGGDLLVKHHVNKLTLQRMVNRFHSWAFSPCFC